MKNVLLILAICTTMFYSCGVFQLDSLAPQSNQMKSKNMSNVEDTTPQKLKTPVKSTSGGKTYTSPQQNKNAAVQKNSIPPKPKVEYNRVELDEQVPMAYKPGTIIYDIEGDWEPYEDDKPSENFESVAMALKSSGTDWYSQISLYNGCCVFEDKPLPVAALNHWEIINWCKPYIRAARRNYTNKYRVQFGYRKGKWVVYYGRFLTKIPKYIWAKMDRNTRAKVPAKYRPN